MDCRRNVMTDVEYQQIIGGHPFEREIDFNGIHCLWNWEKSVSNM